MSTTALAVTLTIADLDALIRRAVDDAVGKALAEQVGRPGAPAAVGWLRTSDAAALAGMSRGSLHSLIVAGQVPDAALLRCGRQHRIAAWWAAGRRSAA